MFMFPRDKMRSALVAALLLAAPTMAAAQSKVEPLKNMTPVRMSHVPSFVYAGMYLAVEKGYFKERGLDVELVIVRGGDTTYQVAGKTIEFSGGSADSAFFNSIKRGLPLITIGSLAVTGKSASTNPLMVRKDLVDSATVTKIGQLKGRKVANLAPGGITEYLLNLAIESGGLSIKDVDVVMPMGFSQMVEALSTKSIDAAALGEPFATMAERRGSAVRMSTTHDLGEQILIIKTSKDYAKSNPDVVENFLLAFLKGARDLADDGFRKPENLKIMEKYTKVPSDILMASTTPVVPSDGALNVNSIMKQQRYYSDRGYLTSKDLIQPDGFIDTTYLRRAVQTLDAAK